MSNPDTLHRKAWHRAKLAKLATRLTLFALAACCLLPAQAYDGLVKKQTFSLPSFSTVKGQAIKPLQMGYESYGQLNAARDNVILISHFITGTSHAAGKYADSDKAPGYWDALIGPGKAFDTERFFIIATDSLANPSPKLPQVVSSGPASVNPETGKPYGLTFPVLSIRDTVEAQKALLESLSIRRLHAVAGASAGAWLSVEWASAYPERVQRLISVAGPGVEPSAYGVAKMSGWGRAVLQDPKWAQGDYHGKPEPLDGLREAMRQVTLDALSFEAADKAFGLRWADPKLDPGSALSHPYAVEDTLNKIASARAQVMDANNWLYTLKALQLPTVKVDRIKARSLFLAISSDLIFPPYLSRQAVQQLQAQGTAAEFLELKLPGGHADALGPQIQQAGPTIAAFLNAP